MQGEIAEAAADLRAPTVDGAPQAEVVQADQARRAALFELGDRLRDLDDPGEMAFAAAEVMGRTLVASRAGYGTVDQASKTVDIDRDWTSASVDSIAGSHRFDDFGAYLDDLQRGDTVAFADAERDPRTAERSAAWLALGARSVLNLPILERGGFVAVFYIHHRDVHDWSADEIVFVRDVAERARAAIERRRAELNLRALAQSLERQVADRTAERNRLWRLSMDIMLVTRFDGAIVAANPAMTEVLGWSEAELRDHRVFELIHADDIDDSRRVVATIADGTTLRRFDNRWRHRDGSYRWISWTGTPGEGLIHAVGRDVTSERERTAALVRSEARLRSVFATSFQFLGLLTTDGVLVDANAAALAAIAARLDDVVGRQFWDTPWFAGTPGMADQVRAALALVAGGKTFRQEIVVALPTGRRAFDFAMRPVYDGAEGVISVVFEAIELTERRTAEEQLRQAQKMEAVGQLSGGLAHDFNNLLTGITGSLELLATRIRQGRIAETARFIVGAQTAAARAAALTHRLLAFSRRQTLDPQPLQPNRLVEDIADLLQRSVGPSVTVTTRLAGDLWQTLCDRSQLEGALLNLSLNARDAMPRGGDLGIATVNVALDARTAALRDMAAGDYVCIAVSDSGTGMTAEVAARAFDPFFTTKPLGEGTGLGLSMIYGFAKQSGGQVRIESQPGAGTTMRLYLPRHWPDAAAPGAGVASAAVAPDGETVLVVDDEATVRMLVTEVVQDLGYAMIEAADGPAALQVLDSGARIDLLITDVGLPGGLNGWQVADAARKARPDLKVLFITGYAQSLAVGGAQLAPGMQVMTKPFEMDKLAVRIKAMLGS